MNVGPLSLSVMAADEALLVAEHNGCDFEIQERRGEGFYVWRFVGASARSTQDYLQDDLAMAKRCALDAWGVPESAWYRHQRLIHRGRQPEDDQTL